MEYGELLKEAIKGHRLLIGERYAYRRLDELYEFGPALTEERLTQIKDFVLEYVYPDIAGREELEEAFSSLDDHVKHPEHLGRILLDSASLLFKYGRHIPKIMRAGMMALKSFRAASKIEKLIADTAFEKGSKAPFSPGDIQSIMSLLPHKELDNLVDSGVVLFDVLVDRKLVGKIIEMIDHLIKKMQSRPNVYSANEVKGMQLGHQIIRQCSDLFYQFSESEQKELVQLITEVERDAIEHIKEMQ